MKNTKSKRRVDMLAEYDFSKGVRGKYAKRYATGHRTIVKKSASRKVSRTNWARIDALRDDEIDFSDIPEQGKAFFKRAVLRLPQPKATITIRLDRQVLDWFKAHGRGYQTRINALLRAYREAHKA